MNLGDRHYWKSLADPFQLELPQGVGANLPSLQLSLHNELYKDAFLNSLNFKLYIYMFEALTAVDMKITVLWDVTPCMLCLKYLWGYVI
jgi:hypothetical protein